MTPARSEEERVAFDNLVTERLDATHLDTRSDHYGWCGRPDTRGDVLPPIGVSALIHDHGGEPAAMEPR